MQLRPILLALTLALVACGGTASTDPLTDADRALQAGDSTRAAGILRTYLAGLAPDAADLKEATIKLCSALAEKAPAEATATLLEFAAAHPDAVTPRDFKDVQSYLQTHEHYSAAVDVMDAGLKRWQADPTMQEVKDLLIARIQSVGDAEATKKLKGLGYL